MPVSRKPDAAKLAKNEPTALEEVVTRLHVVPPRPTYPRRVTLFTILRDESGSMATWREKQGKFVPGLLTALTDAGGPRIADMVYLLYVVVSGTVTTTGFAPLSAAKDPVFEPDGQTPIGQGLKTLADQLDGFVKKELIANEVTVSDIKVAAISDLHATGETDDETAAGVERFLEVVKKYKADVQLIGPSEAAMNNVLAATLDVNAHGVTYLDGGDPESVFKWTFDSLLSQSRKLTGSRRTTKPR